MAQLAMAMADAACNFLSTVSRMVAPQQQPHKKRRRSGEDDLSEDDGCVSLLAFWSSPLFFFGLCVIKFALHVQLVHVTVTVVIVKRPVQPGL